MTEEEMVGWHHRLNGHECERAPGAGEERGGLACCRPRGRRVGHDRATEQRQRQQRNRTAGGRWAV